MRQQPGHPAIPLPCHANPSAGDGRAAISRASAALTVQVPGVAASRAEEQDQRSMTASNSAVPVWQGAVTRRDTGTPTMRTPFSSG